jgi:hypothetical protein
MKKKKKKGVFYFPLGQRDIIIIQIPCQQEGRVVMVRTRVIHVVENPLPLAEIT